MRDNTVMREAVIDDATVNSHTKQQLQFLMDGFSQTCKDLDLGLAITLKKTKVLGQGVQTPPVITIDNYEFDAEHKFTCPRSSISEHLSPDVEVKICYGNNSWLTTVAYYNLLLKDTTKCLTQSLILF